MVERVRSLPFSDLSMDVAVSDRKGTERSCAAPISYVKSHILDRCSLILYWIDFCVSTKSCTV